MNVNLKGSSIIEVIVAFAIISLTFTLFSVIQNNLQSKNSAFSILKAHHLVNSEISKLRDERPIQESFEIRTNNFIVKRVVIQHPLISDCNVLRWIVLDNKMKIVYSAETVQQQQYD